jgi:carbamate kinase
VKIVIALGGNALLRRGEVLSAAAQQNTINEAALLLAKAVQAGHQVIVTHGNGPQVGLLALQSAAGPEESILPLDVLGAESEGWIGYAIELAVRNALPDDKMVVTLLTQTLVETTDPAFQAPTKPIGPVYDEATARRLAAAHKWAIAPDGKSWRRVVASPKPLGIVEITSIMRLVELGVIVICGGGGGIPVAKDASGKLHGVEAVIDKDATSALLAAQVSADLFVMLTDVDGVYLDYGKPGQHRLAQASPLQLETEEAQFKAGSMGPKVAAACRFARQTGKRAAIGALADLNEIIAGHSGTSVFE